MEKNRVEVVIDGQIITLVSNENEAYMQKLALYIDKKLAEIRSTKSNKPVTEYLRTLLISVNIADDYFKAVEQHQVLEKAHQDYMAEKNRIQEENALLADKLHQLQSQLSVGREQYSREVGQLQEENTMLSNKVQALQTQMNEEMSQSENEITTLREKCEQLTTANRNLQEQLQYTRNELDEYISNFDSSENDDRQNVVNFAPGR